MDGCQFPFENGKLVLNLVCGGGGDVTVKASSSLPDACAVVSCPDSSIVVQVERQFDLGEGLCTATAQNQEAEMDSLMVALEDDDERVRAKALALIEQAWVQEQAATER